MLGKLIKYECRATGRIMLPIYAATVSMGMISSVFIKFMPSGQFDNNILMNVASVLSIMLFSSLVVTAIVLSFVISIIRFKKNLLGPEGYLMNTLPVSTWQNTGAKLMCAVLFEILSVVVTLIAGFLFVILGGRAELIDVYSQFQAVFMQVWNQATFDMWVAFIEVCVLVFLGVINMNLMIYAAMSVGHSAASRKTLASIGAFVAFYIISQFINALLVQPLMGRADLMENFKFIPYQFFAGLIVIELFYISAYYVLTNYFLQKKLNLQ